MRILIRRRGTPDPIHPVARVLLALFALALFGYAFGSALGGGL